jgi:plastocyanin
MKAMIVNIPGHARAAFCALALAVAAGPGAGAAAAPPAPVTVGIDNFTFNAATVTVPVGATVTWVNRDDIPHTVTAADGKSFRSKPLDTGDRFSFTFTALGTWAYFCSIHPHMTGKIIVRPA